MQRRPPARRATLTDGPSADHRSNNWPVTPLQTRTRSPLTPAILAAPRETAKAKTLLEEFRTCSSAARATSQMRMLSEVAVTTFLPQGEISSEWIGDNDCETNSCTAPLQASMITTEEPRAPEPSMVTALPSGKTLTIWCAPWKCRKASPEAMAHKVTSPPELRERRRLPSGKSCRSVSTFLPPMWCCNLRKTCPDPVSQTRMSPSKPPETARSPPWKMAIRAMPLTCPSSSTAGRSVATRQIIADQPLADHANNGLGGKS
mmetsp:Transcript_65176/g.187622  ORF Transcript_65176/g.187622 Transcript_65176/m.187622 type:complete len:261 (+) Transcript_65176:445-1227(+)